MMSVIRSFFLLLTIIATVSAGTNQEGLDFLAAKVKEEGVVKLDSGLMYKGMISETRMNDDIENSIFCRRLISTHTL
jgi:hypothetical protein